MVLETKVATLELFATNTCFPDDLSSVPCMQAFAYVRDNGGIDTEGSYPYEASDDHCRYSNRTRGADDIGHVDLPEGDEKQLQSVVAQIGPISVGIDASYDFIAYKKGKHCIQWHT